MVEAKFDPFEAARQEVTNITAEQVPYFFDAHSDFSLFFLYLVYLP